MPIILQCSAFFIVQLSHPYMTTGKVFYIADSKKIFIKLNSCQQFLFIEQLIWPSILSRVCYLIFMWWLILCVTLAMVPRYLIKHYYRCFFYISQSSVQSISLVRLFATHEPQHARPPCPSPTPGVYSNSCPSSRWCHPAISSSIVPFSSCPQSFPASHQMAKVLELQIRHQSFQWTRRTDFL